MLQPKMMGGGRVLLGASLLCEVFWVVFNGLLGGRVECFSLLQGYCNAAAKVSDCFLVHFYAFASVQSILGGY